MRFSRRESFKTGGALGVVYCAEDLSNLRWMGGNDTIAFR